MAHVKVVHFSWAHADLALLWYAEVGIVKTVSVLSGFTKELLWWLGMPGLWFANCDYSPRNPALYGGLSCLVDGSITGIISPQTLNRRSIQRNQIDSRIENLLIASRTSLNMFVSLP